MSVIDEQDDPSKHAESCNCPYCGGPYPPARSTMSDLHPVSEPPVKGKRTVQDEAPPAAGAWEYDGKVAIYEAESPWTTVRMADGEVVPHRTGLVALAYQSGPLIAEAPALLETLRETLLVADWAGDIKSPRRVAILAKARALVAKLDQR